MIRRNIVTILITMSLAVLTLGTWQKIAWNYLRDLGASNDQVAAVYMLILAAFRLPQLLGGHLADRLGRKTMIIAPMAVVVLMYFLMGQTTDWFWFAACWVGATVMNSLQWPAMLSMIAESVAPEDRGKVVGLADAGYFAGITLGPVLGAFLMGPAGWSVSGLVLLSSAGYGVTAAIRLFGLTETFRRPLAEAREPARWIFPLFFWFSALSILVYVAYGLTVDGQIISLYAEDRLGLGKPQINLLISGGAGLAFVSAIVAGYVTDRAGMVRTLVVSGLATAALLVPLVVGGLSNPVEMALLLALYVPTEFCQVAYQKYMTTAISESQRATFVGGINTVIGLGAPLAVWGAGALYDRFYGAPFAVAAAASVLSLLPLPWLVRRGRAAPSLLTQR